MFTSAQIIGMVVITVVVIGVAYVVSRLDSAIIATHTVGEDDIELVESAEPIAAASRMPSDPAGKRTTRRQRKRTSRS